MIFQQIVHSWPGIWWATIKTETKNLNNSWCSSIHKPKNKNWKHRISRKYQKKSVEQFVTKYRSRTTCIYFVAWTLTAFITLLLLFREENWNLPNRGVNLRPILNNNWIAYHFLYFLLDKSHSALHAWKLNTYIYC